jgi:hypothetical protein
MALIWPYMSKLVNRSNGFAFTVQNHVIGYGNVYPEESVSRISSCDLDTVLPAPMALTWLNMAKLVSRAQC